MTILDILKAILILINIMLFIILRNPLVIVLDLDLTILEIIKVIQQIIEIIF